MPNTTTPRPVPLPPGAVFGDVWEGHERVIMGPTRGVPKRKDVVVRTTAIQRADGRIAPSPEPPAVRVDIESDRGLTAAQARQLAAALLDAAYQLDEWEGR